MPSRRRLLASLLAVPLALALTVAPGPSPSLVLACSCGMSERPMEEAAANPDAAVFTGIAGPREPIGVQIRVTRWFHGPLTGSIVTLDGQGFNDPNGASCGTEAPAAGTEWIFISSRDERGLYGVSLCTVHAPLNTDIGAELLADAMLTFGDEVIVEPEPPTAGDPGGDATLDPALVLGLTGAAGVLVLLGAIWFRSRRSADTPA